LECRRRNVSGGIRTFYRQVQTMAGYTKQCEYIKHPDPA
jgi:hypothetical protein